jgi:RNA polymerase sigma factor (sigma-70 family)
MLHKKRISKHKEVLMKKTDSEYDNDTPLKSLMNKELKTILESAVSTLPEKYRIVFVMREIQEMSTNETMEVLNIGESNVKIRLTRAKEMLRNELSGYYRSSQLFEFNLTRCDVIVNYVMNNIINNGI